MYVGTVTHLMCVGTVTRLICVGTVTHLICVGTVTHLMCVVTVTHLTTFTTKSPQETRSVLTDNRYRKYRQRATFTRTGHDGSEGEQR